MNIVRCKVKSSSRDEYLKIIDEMPKFDGQISAKCVETKPNEFFMIGEWNSEDDICLLYTSPSPRDGLLSRMPSSA